MLWSIVPSRWSAVSTHWLLFASWVRFPIHFQLISVVLGFLKEVKIYSILDNPGYLLWEEQIWEDGFQLANEINYQRVDIFYRWPEVLSSSFVLQLEELKCACKFWLGLAWFGFSQPTGKSLWLSFQNSMDICHWVVKWQALWPFLSIFYECPLYISLFQGSWAYNVYSDAQLFSSAQSLLSDYFLLSNTQVWNWNIVNHRCSCILSWVI